MSEPELSPRIQDPPRHTKVEHLGSEAGYGEDTRTDEQKKGDKKLAERLSILIEEANGRVVPLTKMIRKVSSRYRLTRKELTSSYLFHSTFHRARVSAYRKYGRSEGRRPQRGGTCQTSQTPARTGREDLE